MTTSELLPERKPANQPAFFRVRDLTVPTRRKTIGGTISVNHYYGFRPYGELLSLYSPRSPFGCYSASLRFSLLTGFGDRVVWLICGRQSNGRSIAGKPAPTGVADIHRMGRAA